VKDLAEKTLEKRQLSRLGQRTTPASKDSAASRDTALLLPGDWLLRQSPKGAGQRVMEVFDASRDLVGFVASSSHPLTSIGGAWRGISVQGSGVREWWALAIGHAYQDPEPCVVFTSRSSSGRLHRSFVTPTLTDGLWVATASGHQDAVSLRQGPRHHVQRVSSTFRGPAEETSAAW
jgi:hypothetical protein